ncbi:MAG: Ig-like domain-containing protein, partial [Bacilli bacterium]|nr:Ig-like domain-containing protein [Bacilli bacterium]
MKSRLKKLLFGIFVFFCFFGITDVYADTLNVTLTGTYYYNNASSFVSMLNTERSSKDLGTVVLDRDLTTIANWRAKELSLYYSANHVRPDGTDAYDTYGYSYESTFASRSDGYTMVYNSFMNDATVSSYLLNANVKSIGVGCFGTQNGYYYWVVVYSSSPSYNASTLTGTSTKSGESVLIDSSNISVIRVDDLGNWNHAALGDVYALNGFSLRNNGFTSAYTYIENTNGNWVSLDQTIATVSDGVIRTRKMGTTTINVTLGNASKSYTFVVDAPEKPIEEIVLSTTSVTLDEGQTKQLAAQIFPTDATEDKTLDYRSLDEDIAIVNRNGLITAVSPGTTSIIVSSSTGEVTATCNVIVNEVEEDPDGSFHLPMDSTTLGLGTSSKLIDNSDGITWSSSNEEVCIVDQDGHIVGVGTGTAIITATTADGQSDTCLVSVSDEFAPESDVEISQDRVVLKEGEQSELSVLVDGEAPGDSAVSWSSSDPSVVAVDENGNVTAVGNGTATVIAIYEDGSSSTCEVTVSGMLVPPEGVSVNYAHLVLNVGDTGTLRPHVTPENATNKSVTFESADSSIATVDENGVVTGVRAGNTTITITTMNGLETTCDVTVNESASEIRSVEFAEDEVRLFLGEEVYLSVILDADSGADRTLTWQSSNTNVITITNGLLKAVGMGSSRITVTTSNGLSDTCLIMVEQERLSVVYRTHIQDLGDSQGYVRDGQMAGTSHQSRRLESISILLESNRYEGSVKYVTHVQDLGWEDEKLGVWKKDGEISGTSHQSKRLEAIKIYLDGDIANFYDIYYRVHAQEFGWMGWAKNGEAAGTASYSYRLEAIEIVLVRKGEEPPVRTDTKTAAPFVQKRVGYATHIQDIGWQEVKYDGKTSGTHHQSKRLEAIYLTLHNANKLYGNG